MSGPWVGGEVWSRCAQVELSHAPDVCCQDRVDTLRMPSLPELRGVHSVAKASTRVCLRREVEGTCTRASMLILQFEDNQVRFKKWFRRFSNSWWSFGRKSSPTLVDRLTRYSSDFLPLSYPSD